MIDVQTGAALNNLYHAGWPRGPWWAPVCLWVVPPTHYPYRNSVVANGPDWGIGLSAPCEPSFFFLSVWSTPCAPLLHPTSLFCHHLSVVTESPGIWRRERECQLALAFLTNLFFSAQRPWITCSWFLSVIMSEALNLFCYNSGVKMGQVHVISLVLWCMHEAMTIFVHLTETGKDIKRGREGSGGCAFHTKKLLFTSLKWRLTFKVI